MRGRHDSARERKPGRADGEQHDDGQRRDDPEPAAIDDRVADAHDQEGRTECQQRQRPGRLRPESPQDACRCGRPVRRGRADAAGDGDGQQRPGQQLEGAGARAEVDLDLVARAERQRGPHRRHGQRAEHQGPRAAPGRRAGQGEGQQRDDDVELLLDRQRPEVLHDARLLVVGAVGDALGDEVPVGDVRRRPTPRRRAACAAGGDRPPWPPRRRRGRGPGARRAGVDGSAAAQKSRSPMRPAAADSESNSDVIRKPESTKKIDTPRNPPGMRSGARW